MGEQTSKMKKYMIVTVDDFMKFKSPWDFEEKPPRDLDYSKYKKKKFYKEDVTDEELEQHLRMVEQREKLLQDFPFQDQADRYSWRGLGGGCTEFNFFLGITPFVTFLLLATRFYCFHSAYDLFSRTLWWNNFFRLIPGTFLIIVGNFLFKDSFNIIQNSYFMAMRADMSFYAMCDEELDAFQDVEEMKYEMKMPSYREYHSYRRAYHQNAGRVNVGLADGYYRRLIGNQTDIYDDYIQERTAERKEIIENKMKEKKKGNQAE